MQSPLPEVPTLVEAGVPGVTLESYGGLSLPAGTPTFIVRRISDALQKAREEPRVRAKLEASGAVVLATKSEK